MTREAFIRKWLANPQKQYNEQCRDEMRDDLDLVIEIALRQPLVSGSLLCHHNFIQKDTYWKSCTHCGMLAPLGQ